MTEDDFSVALAPAEDLYGGGSRSKHMILKRRSASLSQSAFSCNIYEKIAPNRDYPYEGLFAMIGGDYWKFIDTIALGIRTENKDVRLTPAIVKATPWSCRYEYEADGLTVSATYYLYDSKYGAAGRMEVELKGKKAQKSIIILEPFFDIRFMYATSSPESHRAQTSGNILSVTSEGGTAHLSIDAGEYIRKGRQVSWRYKLGSGYRCAQGDQVTFISEIRPVISFYDIEVPGPTASISFACAGDPDAARSLMEGKYAQEDLERARLIQRTLFSSYQPRNKDVLLRAIGMSQFGTILDDTLYHEAGDFWFRSIWFRDEFEGLIHNYQTLRKLQGLDGIIQILRKSFELQDEHGRIPNRLVAGADSRPDYNSADATLLAFILAGMVVRDTNDDDFARDAATAFTRYLNAIRRTDPIENGPPRVHQNGLLSVPSWHSWTDGMRIVEGLRVPIRVSEAWERELIACGSVHELNLPKFFLPEINAQWMRALEAGWLFSKYARDFATADACKISYNKARDSYKPIFLNPATGFINNLVSTEDFALGRRTDHMAGSPGVVAASMLGLDVFSLREMGTISAYAKERLLRTKWGMPFGIIVKESSRDTYLGDGEYHEAVVWPRDTPYMIRLMQITGNNEVIDGLLSSNLRHQMEEGFVFYNGELFSCDHDLVPVKNPVQWWSQWVDPYFDRPG
ncbi:MAG TPA: hypothetical protein VK436_09550 [Methanocella sp.]|nr:hypothetical protein [Methanocella sp.]